MKGGAYLTGKWVGGNNTCACMCGCVCGGVKKGTLGMTLSFLPLPNKILLLIGSWNPLLGSHPTELESHPVSQAPARGARTSLALGCLSHLIVFALCPLLSRHTVDLPFFSGPLILLLHKSSCLGWLSPESEVEQIYHPWSILPRDPQTC